MKPLKRIWAQVFHGSKQEGLTQDAEINATSIERHMSAGELVALLTQETEDSVVRLRRVAIHDDLDLRHRTIRTAIEFNECEFLGAVDLRHCEFTQAVNLSGCRFMGDFNSGDIRGGDAAYRKDFVCNRSVFHGFVGFNGALFGTSAYFHDTQFLRQNASPDDDLDVDFGSAAFGKMLECIKTVFTGNTSFNGVRCGISGAFAQSHFGDREHVADFIGADFGKTLQCEEAAFHGGLELRGCHCGLLCIFDRAVFAGADTCSNFSQASFGLLLSCDGAVFEGDAKFGGITCKNGSFVGARFTNPDNVVRFNHAAVGAKIVCRECCFSGGADFTHAECKNADFQNCTFQGPATFRHFRCASTGLFQNATFEHRGETNFRQAMFGGSLELDYSYFAGEANFDSACVPGKLYLKGALFNDSLILRNADVKRLVFDGTPLLKEKSDVLYRMPKLLGTELAPADGNENIRATHCVSAHGLRLQAILAPDRGTVKPACPQCEGNTLCEGSLWEIMNGGHLIVARDTIADKLPAGAATGPTLARIKQFQQAGYLVLLTAAREVLVLVTERQCVFTARSLILRGCTFDSLERLSRVEYQALGGKADPEAEFREKMVCGLNARAIAGELNRWQSESEFSRDPYLQMEQFYKTVGDEEQANDVYYWGCRHTRTDALRAGILPWRFRPRLDAGDGRRYFEKNDARKWTPHTWLIDSMKWLAGYGVKAGGIFGTMLAFLVIGTVIFWPHVLGPEDPLDVKVSTVATDVDSRSSQPLSHFEHSFQRRLFDRAEYSLDLFVPGDILHVGEEWEPRLAVCKAYAVIHIIAGWILIPLLIASLSGIIKASNRRSSGLE